MDTLKSGPLSDVNVLDFTWVLAGPHATKTLADMGANVIKVDRYKDGANERLQPLRVEKDGVIQSSYHLHVNRGKKSICVNLKHLQGYRDYPRLNASYEKLRKIFRWSGIYAAREMVGNHAQGFL